MDFCSLCHQHCINNRWYCFRRESYKYALAGLNCYNRYYQFVCSSLWLNFYLDRKDIHLL